MSDRNIVEKFNYLLENYWAEILPKVIIDWDLLSIEEQSSLSSLNNFFAECMSLSVWQMLHHLYYCSEKMHILIQAHVLLHLGQ